jgi:hypothetical protein
VVRHGRERVLAGRRRQTQTGSAAAAEPHPLGRAGLPAGKSWTGVFALFDELHFLTETGMYRRDPAGGTFALDSRYRIEGVEPLRFMPVVADSAGRAWTSPWLGTVTCARPLGYFEANGPAAFTWHDAPARWQAGVGRFGAGLILVETEGARTVLWTKSPTSIARIELDTLPANRPAASWQPVLRRFTVGERSWPVATNTTLHLPFSNQPLTLRYAAPRYQPGGAIRYQTRLLGFREQWSAPSPSTETVFTNLTGGPFAFEVRAIDADGFASETARVFFSVAPPWHRSGPAVVLYVAALTGAVVGFVRWRLRQAERERLRLEQLVPAHRGAPPRQGRRRGRQPREERLPRQHEPRAAHAAQRRHRLRPGADEGPRAVDPQPGASCRSCRPAANTSCA